VKFFVLAFGLTPQLTSGFITPSKVRCFSFFGFGKLNFLACTGYTLALADQTQLQAGRDLIGGPVESIESEGPNAFLFFSIISQVV
jgi:hypothetical protein